MSKRRTFAILSVGVTLTLSNNALAGPFTDINKLGDLMMAMAPAYALGMTVMEKDWWGTMFWAVPRSVHFLHGCWSANMTTV